MRTSKALLVLVLCMTVSVLSACSDGEGELTGEVFIVTKGGQNVRLGLVEVRAIPEGIIRPFIDQKNTISKAESDKLRPEIERAKLEVAEAQEGVEGARRRSDEQFKASLEAIRRGDYSVSRSYSSGADNEVSKLQAKWDKQTQLQGLLDKDRYWRSGDFYFADLPAGIATAKTDADGKFTLTLKRKQRVALAARGSRSIGDKTEKYHWLFWFSLEGMKSKRIFLSNDNLITAGSADSLVRAEE